MIGSINNLLPFANIKFEILSKKEKKGKTSFSFYFSNVKIYSQIQWNNRVCAFKCIKQHKSFVIKNMTQNNDAVPMVFSASLRQVRGNMSPRG